MSFESPARLLLLVAVAGVLVAYLVLQFRRRAYAVRFTNVELLETVAPKRPGWRRHVPAATFLLVLALLVVAFAGPRRTEQVPRERATVVLALDVSLSMMATDVEPSRLDAAQDAALGFLDDLPEGINVGLVSFAGTATTRVPPTTDRQAVSEAITRLQLDEATTIGGAVLESLAALDSVPPPADDEPVPALVVVMSDGESTVDPPVTEAVAEALEREVPVTTIAFGTSEGFIVLEEEGVIPVPVAERELSELAEATGGRFFAADSAGELSSAYDDIGSAIGFDAEEVDISGWFVGFALLAAFVTAGASLFWFSRLP